MEQERKVERIILMAAGFGSRMSQVTAHIPKPLVRVNGTRLIDTVLDAALAAGIEDIVVVRGYMADAFDELLADYPMVRFVDNKLYDQANNISSVLAVADLLGNAYVAEADLLLSNPALIAPTQSVSNYLGVPCAHTDDWAFRTSNENGRRLIEEVLPGGGDDLCHMYGISYWTPEDAALLANELHEAFDAPGGHDLYFEQVPLERYARNHKVYVRECTFDDICEIDTFDELCELDPSWQSYAKEEA